VGDKAKGKNKGKDMKAPKAATPSKDQLRPHEQRQQASQGVKPA
jgi:hypothetical protein